MTHKYIYTFFPILILLLIGFFSTTLAEKFSFFSISNPGGNFASNTSTVITPINHQKIFWSFHESNLANGQVTTEATRIHIPRNRSLYIMSTEENFSIEKFTYTIESQQENNFFRVFSIQNNPVKNFLPTITLENDSKFSFTLKDWKILGKNTKEFLFNLPDEEMESGEKRTFIIPLQKAGGVVQLISPLGRVKDKISYPSFPKGKIFKRNKPKNKKDVRPEFEIIEEKE